MWKQFDQARLVIGTEALQEQKDLLSSIPTALKDTILPGKKTLFEMISRESAALDHVYQDENMRQIRLLAGIWADTTRDNEGAYLREVLEGIYNSAMSVKSRGATKTQFTLMHNRLAANDDNNIYAVLAKLICKTFDDDAEQYADELTDSVATIFRKVASQAQMMIRQKEQEVREHPQLKFARFQLQDWVKSARVKLAQANSSVKKAKRMPSNAEY